MEILQVQNKILKTDEKFAVVVETQNLVLNDPKLEFHLYYLETAKTWSSLNPSEPFLPQL